jgi:hypothetical protein
MNPMVNYWTNVPHIFNMADLENKKVLLLHDPNNKNIVEEFKKVPAWQTADKIFIVGQEAVFADLVFEDSRVHVWDSLYLPDNERFHSYFFWWHQTKQVESYFNGILQLTSPLENPPEKIFEFLIRYTGRAPQRIMIKDLIIKNNLQDQILHNFNGQWIIGTDVELTDAHDLENCCITYNQGETANNSNIVPYKIYNQSWFSVVSESLGDKRFFTEKTAKAFLAKRLFVFIGAQNSLSDLRSLGYKTFDGIIDESYDCIENNHDRWSAAFEQIQFICQQDPAEIYRQALPILEHNQKTLFAQDWLNIMVDKMKSILSDK